MNGACAWTPHIVRAAVNVELILHVCGTHSMPLSHSDVCLQIWAKADVDEIVPGQLPFDSGVAQDVSAEPVPVEEAFPQHT